MNIYKLIHLRQYYFVMNLQDFNVIVRFSLNRHDLYGIGKIFFMNPQDTHRIHKIVMESLQILWNQYTLFK